MELEPGVYEELVTRRLQERLDELVTQGRRIRRQLVDTAEAPGRLARHVGGVVELILDQLQGDERVGAANQLLALAVQLGGLPDLDAEVVPGPQQLEEVAPVSALGERWIIRPQLSLARTTCSSTPGASPSWPGRSRPSSPRPTGSTCCARSSSSRGCA